MEVLEREVHNCSIATFMKVHVMVFKVTEEQRKPWTAKWTFQQGLRKSYHCRHLLEFRLLKPRLFPALLIFLVCVAVCLRIVNACFLFSYCKKRVKCFVCRVQMVTCFIVWNCYPSKVVHACRLEVINGCCTLSCVFMWSYCCLNASYHNFFGWSRLRFAWYRWAWKAALQIHICSFVDYTPGSCDCVCLCARV